MAYNIGEDKESRGKQKKMKFEKELSKNEKYAIKWFEKKWI